MFVLGMAVGTCFGIVFATLLVTAEDRSSSAGRAELEGTAKRIEELVARNRRLADIERYRKRQLRHRQEDSF